MDISGVGAIVTGGASGLGAATVRRLSRAGARVAIIDINSDLGVALAKEVGGHFCFADVAAEDAIADSLIAAEAIHGTARVLVNCAGMVPPRRVIDKEGRPMPLGDFAKIISVNLLGTFNVLSKFAALLHEVPIVGEERGVIINTASIAAFEGQIGQAAYSASKGGVVGLMLPIARELAHYGIRVMTVAPGLFRTPLLDKVPDDVCRSLGRQVPFPNRLGQPDEFAQLVEAIIKNPMLNGEVIRLDGAMRMAPK